MWTNGTMDPLASRRLACLNPPRSAPRRSQPSRLAHERPAPRSSAPRRSAPGDPRPDKGLAGGVERGDAVAFRVRDALAAAAQQQPPQALTHVGLAGQQAAQLGQQRLAAGALPEEPAVPLGELAPAEGAGQGLRGRMMPKPHKGTDDREKGFCRWRAATWRHLRLGGEALGWRPGGGSGDPRDRGRSGRSVRREG
jgi:hypothetical protein